MGWLGGSTVSSGEVVAIGSHSEREYQSVATASILAPSDGELKFTWRAVGGDMNHTTVTLDTLPRPFDIFEHPDIAEGHRMQITALSIDERQRSLRLDLAYGAQLRQQKA